MSTLSSQGFAVAATAARASKLSDYYQPLGHGIINVAAHTGDMDLVLRREEGDESIRCRVSSQVMGSSSSYWRAMLDPGRGFKESLSHDEPVTVHDPNLLAVLLLLFVLHNRHDLVPEALAFRDLVDVCMAIDKYDCITPFKLWLRHWSTPWMLYVVHPGYEDWLCIAWVTGDEVTFKRLIKHLVYTCTINDSGQCLTISKIEFKPDLPPEVDGTYPIHANLLAYREADICEIDFIIEARETIFTGAMEACQRHREGYTRTHAVAGGHWCTAMDSNIRVDCNYSHLGFFTDQLLQRRLLAGLGGNPADAASTERSKNVTQLNQDIQGIRNYRTSDSPRSGRGGMSNYANAHSSCHSVSRLNGVVESLAARKIDEIVEYYRPHMNDQRQKLSQKPYST